MSSQNDLPFSQDLISTEEYKDVVQDIPPEIMYEALQESFIDYHEEIEAQEQKHLISWSEPQFQQFAGADGLILDPAMIIGQSPLPVHQIPTNVEFPGQLNFDIKMTSVVSSRNPWIYSSLLKKIYIHMNTTLPIDVQCNMLPGQELFLRATPLYSLPQYAHELVQRCSTHIDTKLPKNMGIDSHIVKHILRSSNRGSIYMGNVETNDYLSVRTPLPAPQAGVDTVRITYELMCKNSCPSGMNRRAVDIIFTLEDTFGNVLGRCKLGVRVCSCPKRDKEKEEKETREMNISNGNQENGVSHAKKRKLPRKPANNEATSEKKDNTLFKIPTFEMIGRDIAMDMLRFGQDRIIAELHHGRFTGIAESQAKDCAKQLNDLMKDLKE